MGLLKIDQSGEYEHVTFKDIIMVLQAICYRRLTIFQGESIVDRVLRTKSGISVAPNGSPPDVLPEQLGA